MRSHWSWFQGLLDRHKVLQVFLQWFGEVRHFLESVHEPQRRVIREQERCAAFPVRGVRIQRLEESPPCPAVHLYFHRF